MIKKILSSVSLTVAFCCAAQFPLSSEEMKEDFIIFKNSISEIHPGLYWYSDSSEIEQRFLKIENAIKSDMELKDFYVLLQEFYSKIRCGHSRMFMPWKWIEYIDNGPYKIPVDFYLEQNRIVTMSDLTDNQSIGEGNEVLSINGIDSKEIVETLTQYARYDGYSETRQITIVSGNFSRYFQAIYGLDSIFHIEIKKDEIVQNFILKGLPNAETNKRSTERYGDITLDEKMLLFKELESSIAYLRFQTFDGEDIKDGKQNYNKFLKNTFGTIHEKNIDKLIIDLRGNSGGEDSYGASLVRYLIANPFDYYHRMEAVTKRFRFNKYSRDKGYNLLGRLLKKDKNKPGTYTYNLSKQLKKQTPEKNTFNGEIIVLVDGGTFSAASEVAAILHSNKRATFIGDETGGGYYGNSSGTMYGIQLPNSRINYYLPVIRYYPAVDHPPFKGRGLIPDISMPETYEFYISPKDEILERAMEEIQSKN
jgi:hypothetical protein